MTEASRGLRTCSLEKWCVAVIALGLAGEGVATTTTYEYDSQGRLRFINNANGTRTTYTVDAAGNRTATVTQDLTGPGQPGAVTFSNIGETSVTAAWGAVSDNVSVAGYEYRLNGGAWQSVGNVLSTTLSGLTAAHSYSFEVRARDTSGNEGLVRTASFSTRDLTPPGQPGTITLTTLTASTATVAWGAATDNVGIAGYEYRLNSGTWVSVGSALSVNLSGLSAGTAYAFEVRARDGSGNLGAARALQFTTVAITITNRTLSANASVFVDAYYLLMPTGEIQVIQNSPATGVGDWLAPKTGMSNYQARATWINGPCLGAVGSFGTWITLGVSTVRWGASLTTNDQSTICNFRLEISAISNPSVILKSAQIDVNIYTGT